MRWMRSIMSGVSPSCARMYCVKRVASWRLGQRSSGNSMFAARSGVVEHVHRVAALGDDAHLLAELLAEQDDAAVRLAEHLGGAVGVSALRDPGDEVLMVHEVGNERSVRVVEGDVPIGDALLLRRRVAGSGFVEEPRDVVGVSVVNRDAVLEVALHHVADVEDVGGTAQGVRPSSRCRLRSCPRRRGA